MRVAEYPITDMSALVMVTATLSVTRSSQSVMEVAVTVAV